MKSENWYLKPNVVIEPLIGRWYAWSHLISPATAAMNLVGRHLNIINSYIQSPQVHAMAVGNPKLLGGPFMDYKQNRVDEVIQLKEETLSRRANLVELARAIIELDKKLQREGTGYSLETLYERVPHQLKGYVELFYDLNNHPSFRFFESLLYGSDYYDKSSQSIALWISNNDSRSFCLSTPRLDDPNVIHLDMPFDSEAIDKLSEMKRIKGSIGEIAAILDIKDKDRTLFNTFFTETPHPAYKPYNGELIRMRYFGHACVLIETRELCILVDPLVSYYGYESSVAHYSDVDLPDFIDYVLITHNHQDHVLLETLLPLRHKVGKFIVPRTTSGMLQDPSLKLALKQVGFQNVVDIDEMEEIQFKNCRITGIPFTGEHSDLNIKAKICYHVSIDRFSLIFMADSRVVEPRLYEYIHRMVGDIDVLFLGMECDGAPCSWLYGPLLTGQMPRDQDQSRRLAGSDCRKGMHLVNIFKPKEVYVYAMGMEPWIEFISSVRYTEQSNPIIQSNMLVNECVGRGVVAERLFGEKELLYSNMGLRMAAE